MTDKISELPGLGLKSEAQLEKVGIFTVTQLRVVGPVPAYLKLKKIDSSVSRNFLYAMFGALEGVSWLTIARERKAELILQLDACDELDKFL